MAENLNAQKVNGLPTFDGQEPPTFGERTNFGDTNMWGNKNFDAPSDFEEIVNISGADISSDVEQEDNFGGFAPGGMMTFGRPQGQFNQPQRPTQQTE